MSSINTKDNLHGMHHSASITSVADLGKVQNEPAKNVAPPSPFQDQGLVNVAAAPAAKVLFATDDWFAVAERLLDESPPHFDPDAYCKEGKVMDGWETRRRREPGHDWCVIKLATAAQLTGIELDTAHFTGNHAPAVKLEVAYIEAEQETKLVSALPGAVGRLLHGGVQGTGSTPAEVAQAAVACRQFVPVWHECLPVTPLQPGYEETRLHTYTTAPTKATHVRLHYFPDGGVARMRLWGKPLEEGSPRPAAGAAYCPIVTGTTCSVVPHNDKTVMPSQEPLVDGEIDLACANNGGKGLSCSNKHYGVPDNLLQANLGRDMGDGWETARHPDRPGELVCLNGLVDSPLSDWCILQLGSTATHGITRVVLDTKHFRGNYPESVLVEGCKAVSPMSPETDWFPLVPRGRMAPDSEHVFERSKNQLCHADRPVTHVRVSIFPDGGLSRVRVYGKPEEAQ